MEVENRLEKFECFILSVAQLYFPKVNSETFPFLFKLTLAQCGLHLETQKKMFDGRRVRNFLLFIYWLRHYPPLRTLGALFDLSKTHVSDIIQSLLEHYSTLFADYVNLSKVDILDNFFLPWTIGIVDGTELVIESWIPVWTCFFYQLLINLLVEL
jgi:hypothetical protein